MLRCRLRIILPFSTWYKNTLTKYKLSFRKYLFFLFVVSVSDLSAVVKVVVQFDLQVDLLDLGFVAGLLVAVEDVDVSHRAVFGAEVLLHALVQAHFHLSVERILLVHFLSLLALLHGRSPAAAEQEAGGQQDQDQQGDGGHPPAHRAAHVCVEGGGGCGLQAE